MSEDKESPISILGIFDGKINMSSTLNLDLDLVDEDSAEPKNNPIVLKTRTISESCDFGDFIVVKDGKAELV